MNTLSDRTNSFYTRFYPSLQSFTGSTFSTLIVGKLEYWFSIPKYVDGFYKFVEPCGHPLYRAGDSWSEELGISRKLFAKAFDLIGVRYYSKSAFLKEEDPFKGKLYASYHDRSTNQTYYVRNHSFVANCLKELFTKKRPPDPQSCQKKKEPDKKTTCGMAVNFQKNIEAKKEGYEQENEEIKRAIGISGRPESTKGQHQSIMQQEAVSPQNNSSFFPSECRSRNGNLGRSYARAFSFIQKNTSSLEGAVEKAPLVPHPQKAEEIKVMEEMIKIWNEEVGGLGVSPISNRLSTRLQSAFKEFFEGSLESWKAYCQMISSSKFLMGEAQNKFFKKAWIIWAIRGENIDRVRGGDFKLGDRKTNHDKKIEDIDREIFHVENKKHQIEMKISNIKYEEIEKRKNIVKDKIKNLSDQERQILEQDFEAFLEQENNSMTEEFRKFRWNGMFISAYFKGFVEEKIFSQVFENLDRDHDEKIIRSSGLLELLDEVCEEITHVKQKKRDLELRVVASGLSDHPDFNPQIFNPLAKAQNDLAGLGRRALSWD
jgi:hypothetical protein